MTTRPPLWCCVNLLQRRLLRISMLTDALFRLFGTHDRKLSLIVTSLPCFSLTKDIPLLSSRLWSHDLMALYKYIYYYYYLRPKAARSVQLFQSNTGLWQTDRQTNTQTHGHSQYSASMMPKQNGGQVSHRVCICVWLTSTYILTMVCL